MLSTSIFSSLCALGNIASRDGLIFCLSYARVKYQFWCLPPLDRFGMVRLVSDRSLEAARSAAPPTFPPDPLPPILKGASVNLLGGSSHVGKTAFIAWLIRQFGEGSVLGYPTCPEAVSEHLYIATARGWLNGAHSWFEGLPVRPYSLVDDLALHPNQLKRRQDRVDLFAERLDVLKPKPHALLWLDPITPFFGGDFLDQDACFVAGAELRRLAIRAQVTIVGTATTVKQSTMQVYPNMLDWIVGSSSLPELIDTSMVLASAKELRRSVYLLGIWSPSAPHQTIELLRDARTGVFDFAPPDAEYKLVLEAIPVEPGEITIADLKATLTPDPISRATLYRHLRALIENGSIRLARRGCYQQRKPS